MADGCRRRRRSFLLMQAASAIVSARGAQRWASGHPWIFRSDVIEPPAAERGVVAVVDQRQRPLGTALRSPKSEISLRLLDPNPDATIDALWWRKRIEQAINRRNPLRDDATAYRLIH